jgi:pimeloyl-ACP methyl ester carboxylesterase
MERIVLVHGSVTGGALTWGSVVRTLDGRFDLVALERPGFPPGPPVERVDFARDAEWLRARLLRRDHLVGHSYGGVVALLAAADAAELVGSLTVIEPPCTAVALDDPAVAAFARGGAELYARATPDEPEAFLRTFLAAVGSEWDPPSPLPPALEQGARMLMVERGPWEAEVPLARLAAATFPVLVVSGAHHAAFDRICDALERALGAERVVLPGFGHSPQRHPDFPGLLAGFVERAARERRGQAEA